MPKQIQEFLNAVREPISKDVALLQLAPSTPEFVNAAKLLEQEWDAKYAGQPRVIEVCRYFARFKMGRPKLASSALSFS
uniref:Uncharacterized protein n=1 Tax=Ditylenchus dipsaci TaxID=166011 RepID=A0A915DII2_9BILA